MALALSAGKKVTTEALYQGLPQWRREFLDSLLKTVAFEGKRVLEIGAGDSALAEIIARSCRPKMVYATDLNLEYRKDNVDNLRMLSMNAGSLDFSSEWFDVVYSQNSFEHIHDLESAWSEIIRVTAPGGVIISHFAPIWSHSYGHHYYYETDEEFRCKLEPYEHLLRSSQELGSFLKKHTRFFSRERRYGYECLIGDFCNKLFPHDYKKILNGNSAVSIENYQEIRFHHYQTKPVPNEVFDRYPHISRQDFEIFGVYVVARKRNGADHPRGEMQNTCTENATDPGLQKSGMSFFRLLLKYFLKRCKVEKDLFLH